MTHDDWPELRCFECRGAVRTEWRDDTFTYGTGESAVELTAHIPVEVCVVCSACTMGSEAMRLRTEQIYAHVGFLLPREIEAIRTAHGLTQAEFAEIAGCEVALLAGWETGDRMQSRPIDRLLRLMEDPGVIRTLKRMAAGPTPPPRKGNRQAGVQVRLT